MLEPGYTNTYVYDEARNRRTAIAQVKKRGIIRQTGSRRHHCSGSSQACFRPSTSPPQLGSGSPTPSPRKERVTSASTKRGKSTSACTASTPHAPGRTCLRKTLKPDTPNPRADRKSVV